MPRPSRAVNVLADLIAEKGLAAIEKECPALLELPLPAEHRRLLACSCTCRGAAC